MGRINLNPGKPLPGDKSRWGKWRFFFLILLVCQYALYSGLTLRFYTLKTHKLKAGSTLRLVLIADLHSTRYGKNQQPLIQKIRQQQPDLILLAGDIADDRVPLLGTEQLLAGLQGLAPIYYVTGNHEYWSSDLPLIRETLQSFGVTILSDEYRQIEIQGNPLEIAGIEDPDKRRYESPSYHPQKALQEAFGSLEASPMYRILLAHRPENIAQYAQYPFDLVLSGHAHGGQVRIPFLLNGLYAPNQGWFPPYAGGLYSHGSLTHIVSRGLSINPRLPRIFNPPELVIITLEGTSSDSKTEKSVF